VSRVAFWGVIRAFLSVINICYPHPSFSSPLKNEDLPAGLQLVFTLNNRFFRHQACYSLLPAKPGGQADRVVSLCKYKVVALYTKPTAVMSLYAKQTAGMSYAKQKTGMSLCSKQTAGMSVRKSTKVNDA
jgi:hypothetical protein